MRIITLLILTLFVTRILHAQIGSDGTGTINGIYFGPGIDLSNQDFQEFDLSNANLRGVNFTDADLSNSNLEFADCTDAIFTAANLSGASFIEANLTGSNLENTNLQGAILSAANLKDCDISGANLESANLLGANLINVKGRNLSGNAIVPYGYLVINGYLVGPSVNLSHADLEETDFRNMDLNGAAFYEAKLSGSNFAGANLNGATFISAELSNVLFSNASFLINPSQNNFLDIATLAWTRFDNSDLTGSDFSFCVLDTTSMFGADLSGARLTGVQIGNTTFDDTIWANVKTISEYNLIESEKLQAVNERNIAVAEKNAAVSERDQALMEKGAAVQAQQLAEANLSTVTSERDVAIQAKESAEADLITVIAEKDAAILAKESAEFSLITVTEERDSALLTVDSTQANLATVSAEKDAALQSKAVVEASLAQAISERDARLTLDEVIDLRPGSSLLAIHEGVAKLTLNLEESSDLENWNHSSEANFDIPIQENEPTKFFRVIAGSNVLDSDNDGVTDSFDAFPENPNETIDTDGDGVGDNADAFPNDASETIDADGDGVGDNADAFPNDASETIDADGDGVGNNADAFPNDPLETIDTDGDGLGDNADLFPNTSFSSNLIASYLFNGDASDQSANNFDGIVYGATLATDRFGSPNSAYQFDGIDDYIDLGDRNDVFDFGNNDFSISLWVKSDGVQINKYIISKYHGYGNSNSFGLGTTSNSNIYVWSSSQQHGSSESAYLNDTYTLNDGAWHHLVLVFSGDYMSIFANGNLREDIFLGLDRYKGGIVNNNANLVIGKISRGQNFGGLIDDVMIFDQALTVGEISNLFQMSNIDTANTASDSDNDGLGDVDEINIGTNPFNNDTDNDLLYDGFEIALDRDPLGFENFNSLTPSFELIIDPFIENINPSFINNVSKTDIWDSSQGCTILSFEGSIINEDQDDARGVINIFDGTADFSSGEYDYDQGDIILSPNTPVVFSIPEKRVIKGFYIYTDNDRSTDGVKLSYSIDGGETYTLSCDLNFNTKLEGEYSHLDSHAIFKVDIPDIYADQFKIEFSASNSRLTGAHPRISEIDAIAGNAMDDIDGDGLNFIEESALGTDPHDGDSDGDSVGDSIDIFPNNPNETHDSDEDGVGDNSDPFPYDPEDNPLNSNLLAYYSFSGDFSDASSNELHLNNHGAIFVTDSIGNENAALSFDGSSFLDMPDTLFDPDIEEFSYSFLINPTSFDTASKAQQIIYKGANNGEVWCYQLDGQIGFAVKWDDWVTHRIFADLDYENSWNYVVVNYKKGGFMQIFINGLLQVESNIANKVLWKDLSGAYPSSIGSFRRGADEFFIGYLDEIRIYNAIANPAEVQARYDSFNLNAAISDSDGDGVGDNEDAFPNDPNETHDSDGDGVGDNEDAFPNDAKFHVELTDYYPLGNTISGNNPIPVEGFPNGRHEWFGHSVAMNADGTIIAAGAYKNSEVQSSSGAVRVFRNLNGDWVQMGEDLLGSDVGEAFGSSVSLNSVGNVLAVGCYNATPQGSPSSQIGNVKVYQFDDMSETWQQIGSDIHGDGGHKDWSGWKTVLNGDGTIVAIGAFHSSLNGDRAGYVKVYELVEGTWNQLGDTIVGQQPLNRIGYTLDLDELGYTLAIGSDVRNAVDVYMLENEIWVQKGQSLNFGDSFDLSRNGNAIIIADTAHNSSHQGTFSVFNYNGANWDQTGNTISAETNLNMGYDGVQITDDGKRVFVAGSAGDPNASEGHIAYYDLNNQLWEKAGAIDYGSILIGDYHGHREIAIDRNGDCIVIGDRTVNNMTGEIKVFSNNPSKFLDLGLVAHYQFIDGFNDTSAFDQDAQSANVSLSSAGAAYFPGEGYMDLQFKLNDYASATFAAWVNAEDLTGVQGIISQPRSSNGTGFALTVDAGTISEPRFALSYLNHNGFSIHETVSVLVDPSIANNWIHLAGVLDGKNEQVLKLYLNGELVASKSLNQKSTGITDQNILIGREFYDGSNGGSSGVRYFKGFLDEVRIYERPLSDNEIFHIFTSDTIDSDMDGIPDFQDAFPNDSNETQDNDGNGIGDNADAAQDNSVVTSFRFNNDFMDENGNYSASQAAGVSFSKDRFGNENSSIYLSGQRLELDFPTLDNYTISFWIKHGQQMNFYPTLINHGNWDESFVVWIYGTHPHYINHGLNNKLVVSDKDDVNQIVENASYLNIFNESPDLVSSNNDIWKNVTIVCDNDITKLYINGTFIGSSNLLISENIDNPKLYIGGGAPGHPDYQQSFYNGHIDDLVVFNRALSDDDVMAYYFSDNSVFSYIASENGISWTDARDSAINNGGNLAIINHDLIAQSIQDQIGSHLFDMAWIGLSKENGQWKWLNGNQLSYTNWDFGEPNGSNLGHNYVHVWGDSAEINGGRLAFTWNDVKDSGEPTWPSGYILQKMPFDRDFDNDGVNDNLDLFPYDSNEWLDDNGDGVGDNYELSVVDGKFTWQDANEYTSKYYGDLAILDTQEKINFSINYLNDQNSWRALWIGLNDENEEGEWRWLSGDPLTFDNWFSGEPSNYSDEDYVHIYRNEESSLAQWNDLAPDLGVNSPGNHPSLLIEYAQPYQIKSTNDKDILGLVSYYDFSNTSATYGTGENIKLFNNAQIISDSDKGSVLRISSEHFNDSEFGINSVLDPSQPLGGFAVLDDAFKDIINNGNNSFTLSILFKIENLLDESGSILNHGDNSSNYEKGIISYGTQGYTSKNILFQNSSSSSLGKESDLRSEWQNFVLSVEDGLARVYVNSIEVDLSDTSWDANATVNETLYFGRSFWDNINATRSTVSFDDLAIYNRALSQSEISLICFNNLLPRHWDNVPSDWKGVGQSFVAEQHSISSISFWLNKVNYSEGLYTFKIYNLDDLSNPVVEKDFTLDLDSPSAKTVKFDAPVSVEIGKSYGFLISHSSTPNYFDNNFWSIALNGNESPNHNYSSYQNGSQLHQNFDGSLSFATNGRDLNFRINYGEKNQSANSIVKSKDILVVNNSLYNSSFYNDDLNEIFPESNVHYANFESVMSLIDLDSYGLIIIAQTGINDPEIYAVYDNDLPVSISTWVYNGGVLFIHDDTGTDFNVFNLFSIKGKLAKSGITILSEEIYDGRFGLIENSGWQGNNFSHNIILNSSAFGYSGLERIIVNESGEALVGEIKNGNGRVLFTGMSGLNISYLQSNAVNGHAGADILWKNLADYLLNY